MAYVMLWEVMMKLLFLVCIDTLRIQTDFGSSSFIRNKFWFWGAKLATIKFFSSLVKPIYLLHIASFINNTFNFNFFSTSYNEEVLLSVPLNHFLVLSLYLYLISTSTIVMGRMKKHIYISYKQTFMEIDCVFLIVNVWVRLSLTK